MNFCDRSDLRSFKIFPIDHRNSFTSKSFGASHSGENLRVLYKAIARNWNIDEKIVAMIVDNAANWLWYESGYGMNVANWLWLWY